MALVRAPKMVPSSGAKRCDASVEYWIHRESLPYLLWHASNSRAMVSKASSQLMT